MKNNYIESILTEIQQLETKVARLKKDQNVSFSFFKESFKQTQEISRLLHELESVHIEDMKQQMEKLVQYLSASEKAKQQAEKNLAEEVETNKSLKAALDKEVNAKPAVEDIKSEPTEKLIEQEEINETEPVVEKNEAFTPKPSEQTPVDSDEHITQPTPAKPVIDYQRETIVEHLGTNNKSLNDIQPINHTIQDVKRSISLNDKFLFQRELFHNNREAMNAMLNKLQSFSSYEVMENYLKTNTHWDFRDETVDKFLQMLKDSFNR